MPRKTDVDSYIGKKFGKLTIVAYVDKTTHHRFSCKCDCGNNKTVILNNLTRGLTSSCGCTRKQKSRERLTTHGLSNTRLSNIWDKMKERCHNLNHEAYHNYGGRGIEVCSEWRKDFMNFYNWAMANGYAEGLTIERVDSNKGYSPDNCTWIPKSEQARNTRRQVYITLFGETKILADWLRDDRTVSHSTYRRRLNKGLKPEQALL